jgi:hypothetical protein
MPYYAPTGDVALAVTREGAPGVLTPEELTFVARLALAPARRAAWIRGRALLHRALGVRGSVLALADGAPRVVGGGWQVGLSHDGPLTAAIARRRGPIAVDLVAGRAERAARALARVRIGGSAVREDPRQVWGALECALKLRRGHVAWLLGRRLRVDRAGPRRLAVSGLGAPLRVELARMAGATIAWSEGAVP